MQVTSLRGIVEDFGPTGLFELGFGFDGGENFLELAVDLGIIEGLIKEARDGVFRL